MSRIVNPWLVPHNILASQTFYIADLMAVGTAAFINPEIAKASTAAAILTSFNAVCSMSQKDTANSRIYIAPPVQRKGL